MYYIVSLKNKHVKNNFIVAKSGTTSLTRVIISAENMTQIKLRFCKGFAKKSHPKSYH